jgi:hypothetical protein
VGSISPSAPSQGTGAVVDPVSSPVGSVVEGSVVEVGVVLVVEDDGSVGELLGPVGVLSVPDVPSVSAAGGGEP